MKESHQFQNSRLCRRKCTMTWGGKACLQEPVKSRHIMKVRKSLRESRGGVRGSDGFLYGIGEMEGG